MSGSKERYIYSGHAVGVSVQFHRLGDPDTQEHHEHVIPALATAVLPVTGGLAHSRSSCFDYSVEKPWKRSLLAVRHAESRAHGKCTPDGFRTEVHCVAEDVHVLEKLHIRLVELNLSSTKATSGPPVIRTTGNKIEGMELGNVHAKIELDDTTLDKCTNRHELAEFYASKDEDYRKKNAWRFRTDPEAKEIQTFGPYCHVTLVKGIHLTGPEEELAKIPKPVGNMIYWPGFGRIYLGEVLVGERDRRVTMVRLDMGSDAGGSGTIGDAGTNGSVSK